ncbi:hypothetical protein Y032_0879g2824 [Ancylostoma ceylanicum]|uniref:Uncharacterized protein n=1 Tax=Ancylostoma ceylanicum TaxID=53326 RepID=A0A016WC85_9BILA|nr:hypothetical protein Y032_0879g2824 [Ancylostoma ceylanicum]
MPSLSAIMCKERGYVECYKARRSRKRRSLYQLHMQLYDRLPKSNGAARNCLLIPDTASTMMHKSTSAG